MNLNDWKIIASYTRADAIADGYQVPILPEIAKEAGIIFPVFFTRGVYEKYVVVPEGMAHQDENARLWDILFMFAMHARKSDSAELIFKFCCQLPNSGDWTSYEKIREVIEKRIFSQVEDLLPVISFGSKKDGDTEKKHGEFVERMVERGYTERQVRRLVEWYMRVKQAG